MVPFFTGEVAFGQQVRLLVFGVNVFDLDLLLQVDSVKQPIKRDFVHSGHMSHRRTSTFNDHLDHCFVVFKDVQLSLALRRIFVCGDVVHMRQIINISVCLGLDL